MDSDLFRRAESLYHAALEVEASRRAVWLSEVCGAEVALRREVESLLAWDKRAGDFLELTAIELAARDLARDTDASPGNTVSHYRILEKLGVGGMGIVYRAEDLALGRFVALKFLPAALPGIPHDAQARERFQREARAASTIDHPNICTIHEIGEFEGRPFIVMELLQGETLRDRIARGPFKIDELLDFAIQVADGLEAAHARAIVHRDLKPANLFITFDNRVKLLDFGLAKLLPGTASAERGLTNSGALMGTAAYMSPEQARAEALDARTDLFSLGAVLYEMATGRAAFGGDSTAMIFHAILSRTPVPASQLRPDLPPQLDRIIGKALEKDREMRYFRAADLRTDLKLLKRDSRPTAGSPSGVCEQRLPLRAAATKWSPRRRTALALAILAAAGVAGIARKWTSPAHSPTPPAEIRPLNGLPGLATYPALRADGSQVAFSWNGYQQKNLHIYVQAASPGGGEPLQITSQEASDISPAWSPDGTQIAFIRVSRRADETGVYVAPSSGGRERLLTPLQPERPPSLARQLAWCADGSLFVTDRETAFAPFRIVRHLNGSRTAIAEAPSDTLGDSDPACSPDSALLAFVRSGKSWSVKDLRVIALQPLANASKQVSDVHAAITGLAWTRPRELLFASSRAGSPGLWTVNVETGSTNRIRGPAHALYPTAAAGTVAFSQVTESSGLWALDRIDRPPHGKPYQLAASTGNNASPQLSPDGRNLVFASDRVGTFEIWIADADGRSPTRLTNFNQNPGAGSPHWSPDSNRIAFDCRITGKAEVYVINRNGGGLSRLTDSHADEAVPTWARDGKAIFFTSNRTGDYQIWKLPLGGTALQITRTGGFIGFEGPDGFLYYVKSPQTGSGIWRVPVGGGAETLVVPHYRPLLWSFWALQPKGIYFVDAAGNNGELVSTLNFQSFDGTRKIIAHLEQLRYISYPGLTVSAMGDRISYAQIDRNTAEIMLMRPYPER